ncbi:MAG: bifunctional DNA-formamidopyrimidine glycosylase/DNA-(apurinic or apyrimidinic site) lyase [Pirellulaceae bacterium]
MPELPEVETMRRGLLPIVGGVVTSFHRLPCQRRPIEIVPEPAKISRALRGKRVTAIERKGKRVIVRVENDHRLVFEPRMTGLVLLDDPPSTAHRRARLVLSGVADSQLVYWDRRGLGSIRLLDPDQFETVLGPPRLGPDALEVTAAELAESLAESRRAVKVALLDQRVLAGVGNLYASELLHRARIHPACVCRDITRGQWKKIHAAMVDVLVEAIRHEGSTLSDGTYRTAMNNPGNYQNEHRVYDREDMPCRTCKQSVRRIVQAQRSSFFCPRCQVI